MLKELIEYVIGVGKNTAAGVIHVQSEPSHVYYLRDRSGELRRTEAEPQPFHHRPECVESFAACVADASGTGTAPDAASLVFYHANGAVALIGVGGRSRLTLDLPFSDQFNRLAFLDKQRPAFEQRQLIFELRTTFRDCLATAGNLVDVLRKVKFNAADRTESEVGHGKVSLGKSIEREVTGTGILPEYVTLSVPLYRNPTLRGVRANVECALEPDAATATFRLIPMPGALELAAQAGADHVGARLGELLPGRGVYFGRPGGVGAAA